LHPHRTFLNELLYLFQTIRNEFTNQQQPSSESLVRPSSSPFGTLIAKEKKKSTQQQQQQQVDVTTVKTTTRPEAQVVTEEK
jgi:hypothetical protein